MMNRQSNAARVDDGSNAANAETIYSRRNWAAVTAITLLATAPFLGKAFHIDDFFYLQIARHILDDPLRPYDFTMFAGGEPHYVFDFVRSPPLFPYLIALAVSCFGESELALHGVMSMFTAVVAASTFVLAGRFTRRPVLVTALVVLNPIFVPGQNLMLDVPMLAFGLGGLALHISGTDRGQIGRVLAGGLLAGLAIVTKYPALVLLPLLAVYSLTRRSWLGVAALAASIVPLAVWSTQNLVGHGSIHVITHLRDASGGQTDFLPRGLTAAAILGSAFFPVLSMPRLNMPRWQHGAAVALSAGLAVLARHDQFHTAGIRQGSEHVLLLASGIYVLLLAVASIRQPLRDGARVGTSAVSDRDRAGDWFLLSWLVLGVFMSLRSPFMAVRHVLWALPAGAIVVTRLVPAGRVTDAWFGGCVAIVAALGVSLAWVDMQIANCHRDFAIVQVRPLLQQTKQRILFASEHGFAYYCAQGGVQPLPRDGVPPPRSIIFVAVLEDPALAEALKPLLAPPEQFIAGEVSRVPLTTMSHGTRFYATGTNDLPWEFGRRPLVYFEAYKVRQATAEPTDLGRRPPDAAHL